MRRRKKRFPLFVLLLAAVLAGAYLLGQHELDAADIVRNVGVFNNIVMPPAAPRNDENTVRVADLDDTRLLELVNFEYSVPDEMSDDLVVPAYHVVPLANAAITLRSEALDAVKALFAEAKKAGFNRLFVSSGYRDADRQKQIYDEAEDKAYVQPPGHSEHQLGLAADILASDVGQDYMAASPEGQWLSQNAWRYGFLLRYPENKSDITGIAYESWHFRYVGQPHARFCYEKGLCFEEYIQFLKTGDGYSLSLDGKTYSVFYETSQNGIINVPADGSYEISSDNTGGYIVTAWK